MSFKDSAVTFFRRFGAFILIVVLALISLSFIAHIPVVQKFGVQHIASVLTNVTGSRVEVGRFHFNFFSALSISEVYVESPVAPADTMLTAGKVEVRFGSLVTLLNKRLVLRNVRLEDIDLHFERPDSMEVSTITAMINRFSSGKEKNNNETGDSGFKIVAGTINGSNLAVTYDDDHKNTVQDYAVRNIILDFRSFDPDSNRIELQDARIDKLSLAIRKFPGDVIDLAKDSTVGKRPLSLIVGKLEVDSSSFLLMNQADPKSVPAGGLNYSDLDVRDINIAVDSFSMNDLNFEGQIRNLSARDKSGFEVKSVSAEKAIVADTGIALSDLELITGKSRISDNIKMEYDGYPSFKDFVNAVYLDGDFKQSRVAIADLIAIAPGLGKSAFFLHNKSRALVLNGRITGNVNRLRGRKLSGQLGRLTFRGDFRSNNLTVKNEQLLNLRLESAVASAAILRETLPGVALSSQYDNLGRIEFSGRFDGFFNDFVANGAINSQIGSATLDMRLNVTEGAARAEYSGAIGLDSFDIGKWSSNPVFGKITAAAQVLEGQGLTAETAQADIRGGIQSLYFKGYRYENIAISGLLDENYFNGELEIVEENVDATFSGSVDLRGDDPIFDFRAAIDSVNLRALNLIQDSIRFSGNFAVAGAVTPTRGIDGFARAADVTVIRGLDETYSLDTISLTSNPEGDLNHYEIISDYINGQIDGELQIVSVYPQIAGFLKENYPALFGDMKVKADTAASALRFDYDLVLTNPDQWGGIFGLRNLQFQQLELKGAFDLTRDEIGLEIYSPYIKKGNIGLESLTGRATLTNENLRFDLATDSLFLNDYAIQGVSVHTLSDDRRMEWDVDINSMLDSLKLHVEGGFEYDTSGNYALNFYGDKSIVFDESWDLHVSNRISWGKDYIDIDSFYLRRGNQLIELNDVNNKGISVVIDSFDAHFLDAVWDYDKLDFFGNYSLRLRLDNIFEESLADLDLQMSNLIINDDDYGNLDVVVSTKGAKDRLKVTGGIGPPEDRILVFDGFYDPRARDGQRLDVTGTVDDFPVAFLENFLGESISNSVGTASGEIVFSGDTSEIDVNGTLRVTGAATTLDVTGVRYKVRDFDLPITRDYIDLSSAVIEDQEGNVAYVNGGLKHELMKDLTLDISASSSNIIGIDLPKTRDAVFYGRGVGAAEIFLSGETKEPSLTINATTAPGTHIYMPLDQGGSGNGETFLIFVKRDSIGNILDEPEIEFENGIDLELNLTVTQDAQIDLIFDENTRNILQGSGSGSLQVNLDRAGDLTLFGSVEVERGNYLFTSFAVNKPFVIRQGGTIRWSGDPYDAELNITADYTGIRTSLTTLLEEYLVNASQQAQQDAKQPTRVNLEMILTGSLAQPTINFSIEFPEVTGELAGYIDNKMKTLQADPNELNQQVFALLLARTFIPSGATAGNSFATAAAYNTISEFISSQLSFFVSDLLSGAIEDVDFISGIDFDVGYNQSVDFIDQNSTYQEWEVRMRNRLFNDRFIVDVGGSYVTDNPVVANAYFAGDFALEYVLTQDRRLKVRFYNRSEETIEGRQNRTGIGLSYRREFDNFLDWIRGLEKDAKKVKDQARAERDVDEKDLN